MALKPEVMNELKSLQESGELSAAAVVEFARTNPSSELHAEFAQRTSWDPNVAAVERWTDVASEIVHEYRLVVRETTETIKAFVAIPGKKKTYKSVEVIKQENDSKTALATLLQHVRSARSNLSCAIELTRYWKIGVDGDDMETALTMLDQAISTMENLPKDRWPAQPRRSGRRGRSVENRPGA